MHTYIYIYIYTYKVNTGVGGWGGTLPLGDYATADTGGGYRVGLYTILPLPILCGIYCDNGGQGETS